MVTVKPIKSAKTKKEKDTISQTKVVIRKLPPNYTEEVLKNAIAPIPEHNYFSFTPGDKGLGPHSFARAYINFLNPEDVYSFRDQFDGYVFVDQKGHEFAAQVEYAPFQRIPKLKPQEKDARCGSIDNDPDYVTFIEKLQNPETVSLPQMEALLEEIEASEREAKANSGKKVKTPLVSYVENLGCRRRDGLAKGRRAKEFALKKASEVRNPIKRRSTRDENIKRLKDKEGESINKRNKFSKYDDRFYEDEGSRKSKRYSDSRKREDSRRKDDVKKEDRRRENRERRREEDSERRRHGERVKNEDKEESENDKKEEKIERKRVQTENSEENEKENVTVEVVVKKAEENDKKGETKGEAVNEKKIENNDEESKREAKTREEDIVEEKESIKVKDTNEEEKEQDKIDDKRESRSESAKRDRRIIRNKDRPSIQIYRPGQSRLKSSSTGDSTESKREDSKQSGRDS